MYEANRARNLSLLAFLSLIGVAAVTLVLGAIELAQDRRVHDAQEWVSHTDQVLLAQSQLDVALRDAERGQRGYLLTGRPNYLVPYEAGRKRVPALIATLLTLTRDNEAQRARIVEMEALANAKLAELAQSVELRNGDGAAAASALVNTDEGLRLMDTITARMTLVTAEEKRLLKARLVRLDEEERTAHIIGIVGSGLLAVLLLLSAGLVRRAQRLLAVQGDRLQQLVCELEAEGRRKEDLLATLAHEMRNPLAPLQSSADMLQRPQLPRGMVERLATVILRQVAHMKHLLDDLLTFTRLSHGKVALEMRPAQAVDCIEGAIEMVQPMLSGRHQRLEVHVALQGVTITADPPRVTQVIANLLGNASKFSPEEAGIELEAGVEGDRLEVTIVDHGIGIPPSEQPRLFDRYYQVGASGGRERGGLGIGLALVRQIVEMHAGSVTVHSAGAGLGTTATVRLPLSGPGAMARDG